jgi:hypothetical protein
MLANGKSWYKIIYGSLQFILMDFLVSFSKFLEVLMTKGSYQPKRKDLSDAKNRRGQHP